MKRTLIGTAIAVLVAVPATIGLWGNASFSQEVPVRVPASGQIVTATPTPSPSESVDDNGGDVPRDQRVEPGDDRDVQNGSPAATPSASQSPDDNGGDDNSGHGSGNSGGNSGHGEDSGHIDDNGGHGDDD